MNIAIEVGRLFDAELSRMQRRNEDADYRAEKIAERAAELADKLARSQSPLADRARFEALEDIDYALTVLHAMLWAPEEARTWKDVCALREATIQRARDSYAIARAAETQAEREYDTRGEQ